MLTVSLKPLQKPVSVSLIGFTQSTVLCFNFEVSHQLAKMWIMRIMWFKTMNSSCSVGEQSHLSSILTYLTVLIIKHHTSNITYISINLTRFAYMHTHTHRFDHVNSTHQIDVDWLFSNPFGPLEYYSDLSCYFSDNWLYTNFAINSNKICVLQPISGKKGKIEHWRRIYSHSYHYKQKSELSYINPLCGIILHS